MKITLEARNHRYPRMFQHHRALEFLTRNPTLPFFFVYEAGRLKDIFCNKSKFKIVKNGFCPEHRRYGPRGKWFTLTYRCNFGILCMTFCHETYVLSAIEIAW